MSFAMSIPFYAPRHGRLDQSLLDDEIGKTKDITVLGEPAYGTVLEVKISEDGQEGRITIRVEGEYTSLEDFRRRRLAHGTHGPANADES